MRVLIVGSGGREHALAWKIAQSPRLAQLFVAPGNAGTAQIAANVAIPTEGPGAAAALVRFARESHVDLVMVGPEAPLADGLADDFGAAGIPVFGPSRQAAQIEASKAFAKDFMRRNGIATARFGNFKEYDRAVEYLETLEYPVVIKASGLAAGKGVILPQDRRAAQQALHSLMVEKQFGEAGSQVVIEERLEGPEVSLLAFTDGVSVRVMPPAQDHKRLLDGDRGPNTGGMGAYAPAPVCTPQLVEQITSQVLQPAVDGLRAEGSPFVGVLYAGMMLTPNGPKVLEFNCRFGDPETQVILPLLEADLLDIAEACLQGRLHEMDISWKPASAACVVLASPGYPVKSSPPRVIQLPGRLLEDCAIFHAGTRLVDGEIVTAGGRVLGITGWGEGIEQALSKAYHVVEQVAFDGMQYRKDIGHAALKAAAQPAATEVDDHASRRAPAAPARLVVLVSGYGSNLQAILDACKSGELVAEVAAVISNKAQAYGLERARLAGIPAVVAPYTKGRERGDYDAGLAQRVASYQPDWVVLAGWMRVLTSSFLDRFPNRVVNLHPALPGMFPGTEGIQRAYAAFQQGEISSTGVMVHLVPDEGVDSGPVLAQEIVPIEAGESLESLEERIHRVEHRLLVDTLKKLVQPS